MQLIMITYYLAFTLLIIFHANEARPPRPVIIVPGFGGSQIQAKANPSANYEQLWFDPKQMSAEPTKYRDMFTQTYDEQTKRIINNKKYSYLSPTVPSIEKIQYISKDKKVKYLDALIKYLKSGPYKQNSNEIYGTPYDFRSFPSMQNMFMVAMTKLIEDSVKKNPLKRVKIVAFDLGAIYMLNFFNRKSLAWKKRYIDSFISVGAPLGGTVRSVQLLAKGLQFSSLSMGADMFHYASVLGMLPMDGLWSKKEVLYHEGSLKVTADDYSKLFNKVKLLKGLKMLASLQQDRSLLLKPPKGIANLHCIYGSGVRTVESFGPNKGDAKYGDGDGEVNKRSLSICKKWAGVKVMEFKGINHVDLMAHPKFTKYIGRLLSSSPTKSLNYYLLLLLSAAVLASRLTFVI